MESSNPDPDSAQEHAFIINDYDINYSCEEDIEWDSIMNIDQSEEIINIRRQLNFESMS